MKKIVIFEGKPVEVEVQLNEDGSVHLYKGEDRNYYHSEVTTPDA